MQQLTYPFRITMGSSTSNTNSNYHSYSYNLDKTNEGKKKNPSHTRYCPTQGITFQKSKEIEGKTKKTRQASSLIYCF